MHSTLFDKIWSSHAIREVDNEPSLLYVDRHLIHEVTSPQAFEGLRLNDRKIRRADLTYATVDHNIPTTDRSLPIADVTSSLQVKKLVENCNDFGVTLFNLDDPNQGIVHVIGPELGLTLPGQIIVCGDSHTSTHGAFGSFALGIGTSDVEHVLATQCVWLEKPNSVAINIQGKLPRGTSAKDLILHIIGMIGTSGGNGAVFEYRGDLIKSLSMEERMTVCNMSIEGGARAGMISPDNTTFDYVRGKRYSPKGDSLEEYISIWKNLATDPNANFDKQLSIDGSKISPQVTWGTNPGMVIGVDGIVPSPDDFNEESTRNSVKSALNYMGLEPGTLITDIKLDRVFIGSCTNSRLQDLIAASKIIKNRHVSDDLDAMVVPGSQQVKSEAEKLGIDDIFKDAGFDWRESGCSMCLGMNPDILSPQERCASTSNRNFEGRQGRGGRTHLVSPQMAAAAAIEGHFVDIRNWDF